MTIYITELRTDDHAFPSPDQALADPNGLLAFGGDLHPERLYNGYQQGIFPWYGPNEPILWWSPSPRAVIHPSTFKPSKSLKKFQRKQQYRVSLNHATADVIRLCALTRSPEETWLNEEMRQAYEALAKQGRCHSVEVWQDSQLVGGLYGVSVGHVFCGESMFSLATNASKIALWYFCHHFHQHRGQLIDCQVMNPHLQSLGATTLNRIEFQQALQRWRKSVISAQCFTPQWLTLNGSLTY